MNVVVVHAHPEARSFSSALARTASETLSAAGHAVIVSDLYAVGFNPVSGRQNFVTVRNSEYYKQQQEELYASENNGFAPEIETEIRKLEAADLLIFSFPMWWFGMPGILKGWVDRTFPMGRVYGGGRFYENGLGAARKARALILMTTGGGPAAVSGRGVNPSLRSILTPIQHGVFWFNGFLPLDPFVVWSPARLTVEARERRLAQLRARLIGVFEERPVQLPPLADFPQFGIDRKKRFMLVVTSAGIATVGAPDLARIRAALDSWTRSGFVLEQAFTPSGAQPWRGFLTVRAESREDVQALLSSVARLEQLEFEVHEIDFDFRQVPESGVFAQAR
ncbi:MAG TPA: NAD(P)H-dependent oxidoreductase [Candidatus Solibacter sp.]|nr:NAD(P)H-dependent oxidoreductase [Candidatus Solibacter sp.]